LKKTHLLFVLVAALVLMGVTPLVADTFTYAYASTNGDGVTASVYLADSVLSPGVDLITSGYIDINNGTGGGFTTGQIDLYLSPSPTGALQYSPSGYFIYDNVLTPGADPVIDNGGLLFADAGVEINLFSNGPGSYQLYQNNGYNDTGNMTATPEPASMLLLGTAFFLAAGLLRRHLLVG